MAGQIKALIDKIVVQRSQGNETLIHTTRTKLLMKGVDPSKYTSTSPDDAVVMAKLRQIASDLNVAL